MSVAMGAVAVIPLVANLTFSDDLCHRMICDEEKSRNYNGFFHDVGRSGWVGAGKSMGSVMVSLG
jgi:hypothetical protein